MMYCTVAAENEKKTVWRSCTIYMYQPLQYCNQRVFKVFLTPFFISASSNCFYTNERIPNRMPLTACLNFILLQIFLDFAFQTKWLKDAMFFSSSNQQFSRLLRTFNLTTLMKFGMMLPNSIPQWSFSKNSGKKYFAGRFLQFLNPYGLSRFTSYMCMRTRVCRPFERFMIKLTHCNFICSLPT